MTIFVNKIFLQSKFKSSYKQKIHLNKVKSLHKKNYLKLDKWRASYDVLNVITNIILINYLYNIIYIIIHFLTFSKKLFNSLAKSFSNSCLHDWVSCFYDRCVSKHFSSLNCKNWFAKSNLCYYFSNFFWD